MDADKVPTIIESSLTNGGKRTVVESDLAPGAQAPPHYHTDFTEAFTLLSGSMTVWTSDDFNEENLKPIELEIGKEVPVPPRTLHKFLVNDKCQVKVVFTPGTIGFERTLLLMRGLQRDGIYDQFSSPTSDKGATFYSILGELTNTVFVGEAKTRLDAFQAANKVEIETTKQELVQKYASDQHLQQAAGL
jgi:quercetin dioxygenase-like cupin family protein